MLNLKQGQVLYRGKLDGEDVTVRLAGHDDYDDVMSLSEGIYDGMDYIPSKYHWLVDSGRAIMTLLYVGPKPVSFGFLLMHDGLKSFVGSGARTLPKYGGKGLHRLVIKCLQKFLVDYVPTAETISAIVNDEIGGGKDMWRWHKLVFTSSLKTLSELQPDKHQACEISGTKLVTLFKEQKLCNVLKHERVCVGHPRVPYEINEENLKIVAQENLVFISNSDGQQPLEAITFACSLKAPCGLLFEIFHYGERNMELFKTSMIKVLCRLAQSYDNKDTTLKVAFHLPDDYDIGDVLAFIKQFKPPMNFQNGSAPTLKQLKVHTINMKKVKSKL